MQSQLSIKSQISKTFCLSAGVPLPSLQVLSLIAIVDIGIAALNGLNEEMDDMEAFRLYSNSRPSLRNRLIPNKGYYINKIKINNIINSVKIDIDLIKCPGAPIGLDFLLEWNIADNFTCPMTKWIQTNMINKTLLINWYIRKVGINHIIKLKHGYNPN